MYGAIDLDDTTANGLYVIKFLSEVYTIQNITTIDEQVISDGEIVVNEISFLYARNTNWYWKQQPLQQNIIVTTHKILYSRLDVITIRYVQYIP